VGQELVLATPSTTFAEVLDLVVGRRIHRVYVVDPDGKPVGCATCTDVLRAALAAADE
jgi:CBS domain-containing protein